MSGGNYLLQGGFWSVVAAVQTPGAPLLRITLDHQLSAMNISWPSPSAGYLLEQTAILNPSNWSTNNILPTDNGLTRSVMLRPRWGTDITA